MKTITIFGSSLPAEGTSVYAEAQRLGRHLAEAGFTVCNGGYGGLMEASARGAREAGGHTLGVTCALWPLKPNRWISEEVPTNSYPERLMTLIERGDAYIVLPGGTGTLAELALSWEMMNKSSLSKTVGGRKPLLVMAQYWQPVIECLKREEELVPAGSIPPWRALDIVTMITEVEQAVRHLSVNRKVK